MSSDIGAVVIRLLVDDVTMKEVREVLIQLRDRQDLRERCSTIGSLVEAEDAKRVECFNNMVDILLHWIEPLEVEPTNPILDSHRYARMGNNVLAQKLTELPTVSLWHGHTKRAGAKLYRNQKNECYVTVELYDVLAALEDLWGLQRLYTVQSRKMTEAEYQRQLMNAEAQKRGSKIVPG